jgi:hypothetical protein
LKVKNLSKSCDTVPLNTPRDNNLNTLENSAKYNQEKRRAKSKNDTERSSYVENRLCLDWQIGRIQRGIRARVSVTFGEKIKMHTFSLKTK